MTFEGGHNVNPLALGRNRRTNMLSTSLANQCGAQRYGSGVMPRKKLRIGLLFHSLSSGNLGVAALTIANMSIASEVAAKEGIDIEFVSIGMRDGETPDISGGSIRSIGIDARSLFSPSGLWREFARCDAVLDISGGDSFTDIYHRKRFFFICATKLLVIARRVPLILSPMTIGPFEKPRSRWIAAYIMNRTRATVARDSQSFEVATQLAPRAPLSLAADVAFELPYESRAAERGGDRLRVGVNVSGLLFHEAETGSNRFGLSIDYAVYTRRLIETLLARGAEVHLITHCCSRRMPEDDDGRRADLLSGDYPETIRVPDFSHPCAAKSYISSLDFLVAGRMHACIGAFSAGTPVLPVAYSRKFSGLFGMLGYDAMIPVTGMTDEQAITFSLDALDRRHALAAQEAKGMAQVRQRLAVYKEILANLYRSSTMSSRDMLPPGSA
ncbi:polysaccharide pyruvyl transferase family protein [Sphingomonas corticis]|uniref:Polysaccharide pyruvyl transferase family protein n=1 Tax=Sphingomonas corticis TaxID=2722791 RepID=A0ABX1CM26_9SPHN|nr:polysaccharide pyruvyl transferase family protein [Sphingomonas corticis]NJR77891.1 polysaccharide pyruvyl transferase family protein [Sphingomonas corticis]